MLSPLHGSAGPSCFIASTLSQLFLKVVGDMLSSQHGSSQSVETVTAARLLLGPYKILTGRLLPWSLVLLGRSFCLGTFSPVSSRICHSLD